VGCRRPWRSAAPVCNKLVVLLLGVSGALTVWALLQPVLGLASVALLGWALRTRLAAERSCPVPTPGEESEVDACSQMRSR
jgi:hypothetical protein